MANNNNLNNIPYAAWLEKSLQSLVKMPVKGICIAAILDDGAVFSDYHNVVMTDKLTLAGVVQQDAMLDTLAANGLIEYTEDEDEV